MLRNIHKEVVRPDTIVYREFYRCCIFSASDDWKEEVVCYGSTINCIFCRTRRYIYLFNYVSTNNSTCVFRCNSSGDHKYVHGKDCINQNGKFCYEYLIALFPFLSSSNLLTTSLLCYCSVGLMLHRYFDFLLDLEFFFRLRIFITKNVIVLFLNCRSAFVGSTRDLKYDCRTTFK